MSFRPPKPNRELRDRLWGRPDYEITGERITAGGAWETENLCEVSTYLGGTAQRYRLHRRVFPHFVGLMHAWHEADVWRYVLSIDRFYELAQWKGFLRAHSHGSAFDINLRWNPNGSAPTEGEGTVLPLLEIARSRGWWCGTDWHKPAPKHFELTTLERG